MNKHINRIVLIAGFILVYDNYANDCTQIMQDKKINEISQIEELWKKGNILEYYAKVKDIILDLTGKDSSCNQNVTIDKLFDNLISKEVSANEVGNEDLFVVERIASYLMSFEKVTQADRLVNIKLLCRYCGKIRKEILENNRPKRVVANVPLPSGVSGEAGMWPEAIKDSIVREKYKAAIRDNQENNLINKRLAKLKSMDSEMRKPFIAYLIKNFHAQDISSTFFSNCIKDARLDDWEKTEIINNIRSM
jgi:hypothetical protein